MALKVELDVLAHGAGSRSQEQAADDYRGQRPDEMGRRGWADRQFRHY